MPEAFGHLVGPRGGVKISTIERVGDRLRYWFGLSTPRYREVMRQLRGRRGGVELANLLFVKGDIVRYFCLEKAIQMIQEVMRGLGFLEA